MRSRKAGFVEPEASSLPTAMRSLSAAWRRYPAPAKSTAFVLCVQRAEPADLRSKSGPCISAARHGLCSRSCVMDSNQLARLSAVISLPSRIAANTATNLAGTVLDISQVDRAALEESNGVLIL